MGSVGITSFNQTEEIFRQDREGWTFGKDSTGTLWVGNPRENNIFQVMSDNPENRQKLNSIWEANSFSREIRRRIK